MKISIAIMKQALFSPNYGKIFGDPHKVIEMAKLAESSKWDGYFIYDHVVEWYQMDQTPDMYHPFATLAAVATQTKSIQLGTMVTPLNRRRPWIVAREALTIDQLSGGRFVLGVGIGVKNSHEYEGFGEVLEMRKRAELLDEGLEIIRSLWKGEKFSFDGKHFKIQDVQFQPTPHNGQIPIWVAGTWPNKKPFDRAAKYDGIVPLKVGFDKLSKDEYSDIINYITSRRIQNSPFQFVVVRSADKERKEDTIEELRDYRDAGVTMRIASIGDHFGSYEEILEYIKQGPPKL